MHLEHECGWFKLVGPRSTKPRVRNSCVRAYGCATAGRRTGQQTHEDVKVVLPSFLTRQSVRHTTTVVPCSYRNATRSCHEGGDLRSFVVVVLQALQRSTIKRERRDGGRLGLQRPTFPCAYVRCVDLPCAPVDPDVVTAVAAAAAAAGERCQGFFANDAPAAAAERWRQNCPVPRSLAASPARAQP